MSIEFRACKEDFECSVGYEDSNNIIHIRDRLNNYHARVHIDSVFKYINFLEDINSGVCSPHRNYSGDISTGSWSGEDISQVWHEYLDKDIDRYNGNWLMSRRLPKLLDFLHGILPKYNIKIDYKPLDISEITRDKLNEMSLSSLTRMYKRLQNEHRDL